MTLYVYNVWHCMHCMQYMQYAIMHYVICTQQVGGLSSVAIAISKFSG